MKRTSLEAGTRGSEDRQMTDGSGVMILRISVKVKSGDGGCFMNLQVRWGGCRCDGLASGRTSMTWLRSCLGYHPNLPSNRGSQIGSMVSSICRGNGIVGLAFHFLFFGWFRGCRRSKIDKKVGKMTLGEARGGFCDARGVFSVPGGKSRVVGGEKSAVRDKSPASGGIPLAAEKPSPEARDFPHESRDFPHEARDFPQRQGIASP